MYKQFHISEIKPMGWIKRQLEIQANGLSGNLDKIWPDVRDSAWIGGKCEGWERAPYWLDGFIPLAFLLNDDDLKSRAKKYIDAIVDLQDKDGWICPCKKSQRDKYDVWAFFLIGKVLALYCEFTGDKKVENSLYRSMKLLYDLLKNNKIELFEWGKFRWFECVIALQYLMDHYQEEWITEFSKILQERGTNYFDYLEEWKRPLNKWTYQRHIVNIAMMFKHEAVMCQLNNSKYENKAEKLWTLLEKYNGTAVGTFTGDECLAGIANNRGTELCSVVELMYSCEILYAVTDNSVWADRLQKIAFNALPATLSDDMWTHQYDQMVNQIACTKFYEKSFFGSNCEEAHFFGLEPHFGCCTANHNQGWPKLAMNIFLKNKKGILCPHMLPGELNTVFNNVNVTLKIDTEYPFRLKGEYTIITDGPVELELKIRIPKWAKSFTVNNKTFNNKSFYTIKKIWNGKESISITLCDEPHLVNRPFKLKTVEYGPLVFSLPIKAEYIKHEYVKDGVERKFPYCDYELKPCDEWRYGFSNNIFEVNEHKSDEYPFSSVNPRVTLTANMKRVNWEYADGYDNVSAIKPVSNISKEKEEVKTLYPYGCAKLRMTEMPIVKTKK